MFCESNSAAARLYRRRVWAVMAAYVVLLVGTVSVVKHLHPTGWALYGLAMLPTAPILVVFFLQGQYLHAEKDDYMRDLTMRCLLFGTAGALAVTMYDGFLRMVGWHGQMPQFFAFYVFWILVMIAKATYKISNPVAEGD